MGSVLHKTADPVIYLISVHTPDYDPGVYFINPDVSAVEDVPTYYWKRPLTDPVQEMNQTEKDIVDAQRAADKTQADRDSAKVVPDSDDALGTKDRATIAAYNDQDGAAMKRLIQNQNIIAILLLTPGNNWETARDNALNELRKPFPQDQNAASAQEYPTTRVRKRYEAVQYYQAVIDDAQVDEPFDPNDPNDPANKSR